MENNVGNFEKSEIESGKGMAILSYIIPLIPYFAEKNNKWVRFHAIEGMNLLIVAVAVNIIMSILWSVVGWRLWGIMSTLSSVINIGVTVLCVIGIVNVCKEQAKELPLVSKIKIIKK